METVITENHVDKSQSNQSKQNSISVNAAVICHKGCVRENNEDNFFFDGDLMQDDTVNEGALIRANVKQDFHLFAVCDGMGGLKCGERASSIGVHAMGPLNTYLPKNAVQRAIEVYAQETSSKVFADSLRINEAGKEGTTLAVLYLADGVAHVGNVGDSRVYLLRLGKLFQLSQDQSMVYSMMLRGELNREQMRKHPQGNIISAYLGMEESRRPKPFSAYFSCRACKNDRFMLCSDGLSDLLTHEEIQRKLIDVDDPVLAVRQLVLRALEMGGKDNTTCMVIDVSGPMLGEPNTADRSLLSRDR